MHRPPHHPHQPHSPLPRQQPADWETPPSRFQGWRADTPRQGEVPRQADAPRQELDSPSGPPPRRKGGAWKYIVPAVGTAVAGLVVIGLLVSGEEEPTPKPSKKDRKSTRLNSSHVKIS